MSKQALKQDVFRGKINPRRCNIALDANALDRNGKIVEALVDRFLELVSSGTLTIIVAGGVRDELRHPNTPMEVKDAVMPRIFNLRPGIGLTASQSNDRRGIAAVLQGNAQPDKHAADASHLSEAAETGCAYFVTHDKRILAKRDELQRILPPSLAIVTLKEFFDVLESFETYCS